MKKKLCAVSILLAALMGTMMTGCTKPDTDAAVTNTENVTFTATPVSEPDRGQDGGRQCPEAEAWH